MRRPSHSTLTAPSYSASSTAMPTSTPALIRNQISRRTGSASGARAAAERLLGQPAQRGLDGEPGAGALEPGLERARTRLGQWRQDRDRAGEIVASEPRLGARQQRFGIVAGHVGADPAD